MFTFNESTSDKGMVSYFQAFRAVAFPSEYKFPLKIKAYENENVDGEKLQNSNNKQNPKAINVKLTDLVKLMHGSFDSKPKLIDEFN